MTAILVDDNKESLKILELLITKTTPEIIVAAVSTNPADAIQKIKDLKPQLLFLDIEMPGMTGFELLTQIPEQQFDVIFTTSHDKFALKAFRAGALDYLVKPVQVDELRQALDKAIKKRVNNPALQLEMLMSYFKPEKPKVRRVALTASDHLVFVDTNDIIYCESDSNYTTFFLKTSEKIVVSKTLKDVEEILEGDDFFRIHASYLVNMKHVAKFTRGDAGHVVMSNNQQLTISRKKKDEFFEMFSRL